MGLRISRTGIAVLVTLFLASPGAAAAGDPPPAAVEGVRAVAERVVSWLEGIADRLTGSTIERRGKLMREPASVIEAFAGRQTEAAPTPDPYG